MENTKVDFDYIAENIFFPIYPVIADQIITKTKITSGNCLDIGCGGGHLGLFVAKQSKMNVTLFDKSKDALENAKNRISNWNLNENVSTLIGDVHEIPFGMNSFQLIVSRGSLWFWENPKKAFSEIYRVLSPDGYAYIGGGFGNELLRKEIYEKMKEIDDDWPNSRKKFTEGNTIEKFNDILIDIGIKNFEITDTEKGLWIIIKKEDQL